MTKRNRPNMAVGQNVLVALWMVVVTRVCINHFGNDGSLGVQGVDPLPDGGAESGGASRKEH